MDLPFNPPQHHELTARIRRGLKNGKIIASPLPLTPEIRLYLLNPDYPQHSLTGEEIQALMKEPPFWSFCWSSGQVLARWIMEREELVKGRRCKTILRFISLDLTKRSGFHHVTGPDRRESHFVDEPAWWRRSSEPIQWTVRVTAVKSSSTFPLRR
jgi:hypothetical protein